MANEQNLTHKLTANEARKGGKRSGEVRRERANLRKCIEILLEGEMKEGGTGAEAVTAKLFKSALEGDVRAFEVLRDTAGQKPSEKVMLSTVDPAVIADVEEMVKNG